MSSIERQGVRVWVSRPDKRLHPNGGVRHNPKAINRLKAERKETARLCTMAALHGSKLPATPDYAVLITHHDSPRSAPRMDKDNIAAWYKADLDGVAEAIGVDDRLFLAPEVRIESERDESRRGAWIEVWAVQGEGK